MSSAITFLPVDNIIPYFFIAAVFEALAVYLYQFRRTPGAMLLVYCQVCKSVWVAAEAFCTMSPELPAKMFWVRFTDWAPLLLIYFWFEFIWKVSQQKGRAATAVKYAVRGITAVFVLIIAFDSHLGWYYGPMSLAGQALTIEFGPAVRPMMVFCYVLNIVCLGISVRWVYAAKGLRRQQAIALAVTPVFNFLGTFLGYTIDLPALQAVSPLHAGQLLSAFYVTWVFYRWRVYSILPLAQDAVTRKMIDGLMVIDEKGYIVDMNPAARTIFTGLPATVGNKFQEAAAAWPELAEFGGNPEAEIREASRDFPGERRFYQISTIPLTTPQGDLLGKTILFKDITQQKHDQEKLLEQQKALSILAERERLGRELHDGSGQTWSYINMQVEAVCLLLAKNEPAQAHTLLQRLANVVRDAHVDIRESIAGLKTGASAKQGLWQPLEEYFQWFRQNNDIDAELVIDKEFTAGALTPTTEVQLLRIIQEALTNIRKHAGARHIKVFIKKRGKTAEFRVEDDGRGFDVNQASLRKGCYGIGIMKERAEEAGAQLKIESAPNAGTTVVISLPLAGDQLGGGEACNEGTDSR